MSRERDTAPNPIRSIELLWGAPARGRRGPKPKLSLDEVLGAAVALADRDGLAALSMRRVAETVGLSPMALYTYAPSKAELVDLMIDRVWAEVPEADDAPGDWRAKLEFVARQQWALGHRHPWMLETVTHRPPLGPNFMSRVESGFRAIDGIGLDELEMALVMRLVTDYARGAVRSAVEAREVEQLSGMTDEQWRTIAKPALQAVMTPEAFPVLQRVGAAGREADTGSHDPAAVFEFGLQRVLDGVAAFVERKPRASR